MMMKMMVWKEAVIAIASGLVLLVFVFLVSTCFFSV